MTEVYELEFSHQIEPQNYGLFKSIFHAEQYMKEYLKGVDLTKKTSYHDGQTIIYDGDYILRRRIVR